MSIGFSIVAFGAQPATQNLVNPAKICIIGKSTAFSGLVADVANSISATDIAAGGNFEGLLTSDPLYKAVNSFIGTYGQYASVHVYGLPASVSAETDVEVDGVKDGATTLYYVPMSPATTGTNPEFFLMQTGTFLTGITAEHAPHWAAVTGQWYNITSGFTTNIVNGLWDGRIDLDSASGLTFSGASVGAISGLFPKINDRMRIDVTPHVLNAATQALMSPEYNFQFFTFAYDPDLAPEYKYSGTNTYSTASWLRDVQMGSMMSTTFNGNEQRTMFVFSLPEKVKPNAVMTGYYTSGTAYNTNTYKWEQLETILGNKPFVACAAAKQAAVGTASAAGDATNIDPAIDLIGIKMQDYRQSLTHRTSTVANDGNPNTSEVFRWRDAKINMVWRKVRDTANTFAANKTFGTGNEGTINFVQCRNLLAYKLVTYMNNVLNSPRLFYDLDGIKRVRSALEAALTEAYEIDKIIDGKGTVTIPIERYLANEAGLSDADAAVLATARSSTIVSNITVEFPWNGDIEIIKIAALIPT